MGSEMCIRDRVGFFDQFYFSRVFKRAKGVPPSKYFAAQQDADPADPAQL